MSRNLCTSTCCGNLVTLADLRGKPIEFRRYHDEPPCIGTRWDCPTCNTPYFVIWRDAIWNYDRLTDTGDGWERGFVLDLSYYATYDDEWYPPDPAHPLDDPRLQDPNHLCTDDADDRQAVW